MEKITRDSWDTIAEELINIVESNNHDFYGAKNKLEDYLADEGLIEVEEKPPKTYNVVLTATYTVNAVDEDEAYDKARSMAEWCDFAAGIEEVDYDSEYDD